MSKTFFVKPFDVIMPRGNRHWGVSSGDFGQINMPPAPSVFAGAFRSLIASSDSETYKTIIKGKMPTNPKYASVLGSLEQPGTFQIANINIGIKNGDKYEPLYLLPNDITLFENGDQLDIRYSNPDVLPSIIKQNNILPLSAILKAPSKKPINGYWLKESGFKKYINGEKILCSDLVKSSELWKKEMRVGVALDNNSRAAKEGQLYSAETISLKENVGFIVKIDGADEVLPNVGTISLGGDQRAANFELIDLKLPKINTEKIEQEKEFKLILNVPAIFKNGWIPDLVEKDGENYILNYKGCKAKLVCASINGYETLSGWNMVDNLPKTAMKTVPAGSVYWFDLIEGSVSVIKDLAETGLWNNNPDKQRVVEGYNRAYLAVY